MATAPIAETDLRGENSVGSIRALVEQRRKALREGLAAPGGGDAQLSLAERRKQRRARLKESLRFGPDGTQLAAPGDEQPISPSGDSAAPAQPLTAATTVLRQPSSVSLASGVPAPAASAGPPGHSTRAPPPLLIEPPPDPAKRMTLKERLQRKRDEADAGTSKSPLDRLSPSPGATPTSAQPRELASSPDGSLPAPNAPTAAPMPLAGPPAPVRAPPPRGVRPLRRQPERPSDIDTVDFFTSEFSGGLDHLPPSPTKPTAGPAPAAASRAEPLDSSLNPAAAVLAAAAANNAGIDGIAPAPPPAPPAPTADGPIGALGWRDFLQQVAVGGEAWQDMLGAFGPAHFEYTPEDERLAIEAQIYYTPSSKPVPMSERLRPGEQPYYLEDEGLYVGTLPYPSLRQLSKMERRVLRNPTAISWFNPDGALLRCPDPLAAYPRRLPAPTEGPKLTAYGKAAIPVADLESIAVDGPGDFQLDVAIGTLAFTQHSLFGPEDLAAAGLRHHFEESDRRAEAKMTESLEGRLAALRESVKAVQAQIQAVEADPSLAMQLPPLRGRLAEYRAEIELVREARDSSVRRDQELVGEILRLWAGLKGIRAQQGFTATPWAVKVYRQATDVNVDRQRLREQARYELQERRALYDEDLRRQQRAYLDRQARRFQELHAAGDSRADDIDLDALPANLKVPFDKAAEKERILARMTDGLRRPGDPVLVPVLEDSQPMTALEALPEPERIRRQRLLSDLYYARVLVNGTPVARTPPRPLTAGFTITFDESFDISVARMPSALTVQVCHPMSALARDAIVCELAVRVPSAEMIRTTALPHELPFATDATSDGHPSARALAGTLSVLACWAVGPDGSPMAPQTGPTSGLADPLLPVSPLPDLKSTLRAAPPLPSVLAAGLDPNDPRNAGPATATTAPAGPHFRLQSVLVDRDALFPQETTQRERIQKLRSMGSPVKGVVGPVPVRDAALLPPLEGVPQLPPIARIATFRDECLSGILAEVRAQQLRLLQQQRLNYSDVVSEDALPTIGSLGRAIAALFAPNRPLRPMRRPRKPAALASHPECKLMVRVLRAVDVPVRDAREPKDASGFVDVNQLVRPSVEVVFQRQRVSTRVAIGNNPAWNEELILPFTPPNNDYSPDALLSCADDVYLNLYDEIAEQLRADSTESGDVTKIRRIRRWLGSTSIPVRSLYSNQALEGFVKIEVPLTLLGYSRISSSPDMPPRSPGDSPISPYLRVYITMDPPLRIPPPLIVAERSLETDALRAYATHWETSLSTANPGVVSKVLAQDINASTLLVTRYVHPQPPPPELVDPASLRATMRRLARFVSAIPMLPDSLAFVGNVDLWCTSDQFLQMLAGDTEEHAILLCNYFVALGVKSWIVIGSAVPEGATIFVLTNIDGNLLLWDALRAVSYEVYDPFCPIQRIGCVFNEDNVWGNIQPYSEPSRISFDVSNPKFWRPLFGKALPNPGLSTVQATSLPLRAPDMMLGEHLAGALEQILVSKMESWREKQVTRWNRHAAAVLRAALTQFEDLVVRGADLVYPDDLRELAKVFDISGFPLNMPYLSVEQVVDAVNNTGVHRAAGPRSEFAIAVHTHVYPHDVYSVWVYVAELVRRE
eukprot:m.49800 g.49800  ORF g.49800 m.49800 type:complete len:1613 (+) comp6162_c0_seq2:71-4909(+)